MSSIKFFLHCVVEAVRARGLKALASLVPYGDPVYEIAAEVVDRYRQRGQGSPSAGVDALASADKVAPIIAELVPNPTVTPDWAEVLNEPGGAPDVIDLVRRRLADPSQDCGQLEPILARDTPSGVEAGRRVRDAVNTFLGEFALTDFRPSQECAVRSLLDGERPVIVLPTGGGKSLCFQLPALALYRLTGGLTVVLSPLQALMEDQILDLEKRGLGFATFVNANLRPEHRQRRLELVRQGKVGLLYLSPEQLRSRSIQTLLGERLPVLWVIDEAHCISQWGHDFRPDYCYVPRFISDLARRKDRQPLLALFTATATTAVLEDVRTLFARHELPLGPLVRSEQFLRENLDYRVIAVDGNKNQVLLRELNAVLRETAGCVLVYTTTRRQAEELATLIEQSGQHCRYYHGGMPTRQKHEVLKEFKEGSLRVVAATCAFGMGINRGDVRAVIHYAMSTSPETYLQETGRAGRDGQPARCLLLYSEEDADLLFALRARSQLSEQDLRNTFHAVRAIRDRVYHSASEDWFWASPDEIFRSGPPTDEDFGWDLDQRDTRLRVALHLLEEPGFLERAENLSSCLRFDLTHSEPADSEQLIACQALPDKERIRLLRLTRAMHALRRQPETAAGPLPTDLLCDAAGLAPDELFTAVRELQLLGVCTFEIPLSFALRFALEWRGLREMRSEAEIQISRQLPKLQQTLLQRGQGRDVADQLTGHQQDRQVDPFERLQQ